MILGLDILGLCCIGVGIFMAVVTWNLEGPVHDGMLVAVLVTSMIGFGLAVWREGYLIVKGK